MDALLEQQLQDHNVALEQLGKIQATLEQHANTGINAEEASYLQIAVQSALEPIGMTYSLECSFESFEGSRRLKSTNITMESVSDTIKKVIEAIKVIFAKIVKAIKEKFSMINLKITTQKAVLKDRRGLLTKLSSAVKVAVGTEVSLASNYAYYFYRSGRPLKTMSDISQSVIACERQLATYEIDKGIGKMESVERMLSSIVDMKASFRHVLPAWDKFLWSPNSHPTDMVPYCFNMELVGRNDAGLLFSKKRFEDASNIPDVGAAIRTVTYYTTVRDLKHDKQLSLPFVGPDEIKQLYDLAEKLLDVAAEYSRKEMTFANFIRGEDLFGFKNYDTVQGMSDADFKAIYMSMERIATQNSQLLFFCAHSMAKYASALIAYADACAAELK